jgi:hypothetical protein
MATASKKKTEDVEAPVAWPRPTHFAQLCEECGHSAGDVPDSATNFACEHGSWSLGVIVSPDPGGGPAPAEPAAAQEPAQV